MRGRRSAVESESAESESGEESEESEESGEESEESGEESEEEELDLDEDGRTAFGGTIDYATRAYSGALRVEGKKLELLRQECKMCMTARAAGVGEELSAGSTFWVPASAASAAEPPATALEQLALQIFSFHTRDATYDPARSGAEWWCQHIDADDEIGFHWDRDYDMQADQGLLLHPHLATVTYVTTPESGNPTLVVARESPLFAAESACGEVTRATACFPAPGRHLAFDGKLLHGAPSGLELGSVAGRRVTFLVNVWLNHVPWGAEPLPRSVAAQLTPWGSAKVGRMALPDASCLPLERIAMPAPKAAKAAKAAAGRGGAAEAPRAWHFGDSGAKLVLELPWPEPEAVRAVARRPAYGGAPFLEVGYGGAAGRAQLRPEAEAAAGSSSGEPAKKKKKKATREERAAGDEGGSEEKRDGKKKRRA